MTLYLRVGALLLALVMLLSMTACGCSHDYDNATCEKPKTCSECGQTVGEPRDHRYSDATCEEPETCRYCDKTKGEPLGHNYRQYTCVRCGKINEEVKEILASVGTVTSVTATHYADIDIEGYGVITVTLDAVTAPETVTNFVGLAESGFYDGLTFHRIMEGFMMQGGDPKGNGTGGSDKNITGEFASNGVKNPLSHVRGAISMARANDPDSASSQFFIVHKDSTFLDGDYAVFGYVAEGMDIVDAICTAAKPIDNNGTILASQQPVIKRITMRKADSAA